MATTTVVLAVRIEEEERRALERIAEAESGAYGKITPSGVARGMLRAALAKAAVPGKKKRSAAR